MPLEPFLITLAVWTCTPAHGGSEPGNSPEADLPREAFWQVGSVCGPNALYVLLRIHGRPVDYHELLNFLSPPSEGSSFTELRSAAERWGLPLRTYKTDRKGFDQLATPFIAHLEYQELAHYGLVVGHTDGKVRLFDPEHGAIYTLPDEQFFRAWSGYALARGDRSWDRFLGVAVLAESLCLLFVLHALLRGSP